MIPEEKATAREPFEVQDVLHGRNYTGSSALAFPSCFAAGTPWSAGDNPADSRQTPGDQTVACTFARLPAT